MGYIIANETLTACSFCIGPIDTRLRLRILIAKMSVDFKDVHSVKQPEKTASAEDGEILTVAHGGRPGLMTRLGLTAESFKQRTLDDKHNQLNKTLKSRHLNMIAIGGSIGAGFFVGSGSALATGGPGALLIVSIRKAIIAASLLLREDCADTISGLHSYWYNDVQCCLCARGNGYHLPNLWRLLHLLCPFY